MNSLAEALLGKLVPTLFEDDNVLGVAKPAGLDVGGMPDQPIVGLAEILADVRGRGESLQPLNRLRRDESGVLLLGKDRATVDQVRADLKSMRVAQEYVGIVRGQMRDPHLQVGGHHGVSRGRRSQLQRLETRPRKVDDTGLVTRVTRLRDGKGGTLIRCQTCVKNTHALRAQLRSAGLRLLGDSALDRTTRAKRHEAEYLQLTRVSFKHPATKAKVSIASRLPESFTAVLEGRPDLTRPLHAALVRRLSCMTDPDTDSFRLLTGNVEGVKGLAAEKFGQVVILQIVDEGPQLTKSLRSIARWYLNTIDARAVYTKRFVRNRTAAGERLAEELYSSRPFVGRPVPEQIVAVERGLRFTIRPYDGFSVGLFLDHRENRSHVRAMSEGKDVLNLFAYTCGFSVAAASGGASSTVSVDLSSKHLDWGRANFELNRLDLAKHDFICSDALTYLRRATQQSREFDIVTLDPPSFAHGRKRKQDFSIARDLAALITASLAVLRPGGTLLISTNYRQFSWRNLRERLTQGAGRRKFKIIDTPRLPIDFACDPNHAKTLFARFD